MSPHPVARNLEKDVPRLRQYTVRQLHPTVPTLPDPAPPSIRDTIAHGDGVARQVVHNVDLWEFVSDCGDAVRTTTNGGDSEAGCAHDR
jgi:hypothetical protein